MRSFFARAWKGQSSLAMSFWIVFFLITLVLDLVVINLLLIFRPELRTSPVFNSLVATIVFPYILFAAICVWRCAKNSNIVWSILARVIVVLAVLGGIYHILHLIGYA